MGSQAALGGADPPSLLCPGQTLCFRVRKMMDVYKPDWCEVREDWSVYLFSPKNRWVGQGGRRELSSPEGKRCGVWLPPALDRDPGAYT